MSLPAFLGPAVAIPLPAAAAMLLQPAPPAGGAAARTLAFTMQTQSQTQWCWAATTSSVATFFGHPAPAPTQCQVATNCLGGTCCQTPGSAACNVPFFLDRALTSSGNLAGTASGAVGFGPVAPAAASVVDQIDAGRPLGCHISWNGGGGHFNVIYGYDAANQDVDVADPSFGNQTIPYATFVASYRSAGCWDFSYLTN